MQDSLVIKSDLKYFLAQLNAERIRRGEKALTIRQIAEETGLATSTLTSLTTNKAKGIQFETLSALCRYFKVSPQKILKYIPDKDEEAW
ncbi:helix-turn-helix domain-containing protein [Candidatus Oscillochloris fontis]|uniref:helix-turn-helix domain-containing protein n=1 Tax=Candidatus Oscillochloris fontis TaxID=2496868 RepID=UPI00101B8226|nr:helix-turn-helix domain-containing protein [Candidatus Oscillochloris fontis]